MPQLELTREVARRFNHYYGDVFPEPKDLLTKFPVLPGIDGRKMSKSYNNTIAISDDPEMINQKVSEMVTDPARVKKTDKGHPDVCPVHQFYKVFAPDQVETVAQECRSAKRGCVACKKQLAEVLLKYLTPIHERRAELVKQPKKLDQILADGAERARPVCGPTLQAAKQAIGII